MHVALVGLPVAQRNSGGDAHSRPRLGSAKDLFADFPALKAALPNLLGEIRKKGAVSHLA